MNKPLLIISFGFFLLGCRANVPLTFNGQSLGEYLESNHDTAYRNMSLHRKWRLRSFNDHAVVHNIPIESLNIRLDLTQGAKDSVSRYYSSGVLNPFWGEYEFDERGNIAILSTGDDRVLRFRSEEKRGIEKRFRRLIKHVKAYELADLELRLYTNEEYLHFYAIN